MNNETYEWLYDNYARDLLAQLMDRESALINGTLSPMSLTDDQKLTLFDLLTDLRLRAGVEVFALGLQLGVRLTAPRLGLNPNIVQ